MNVNDHTNFFSIRKYIDSGHMDSLYMDLKHKGLISDLQSKFYVFEKGIVN